MVGIPLLITNKTVSVRTDNNQWRQRRQQWQRHCVRQRGNPQMKTFAEAIKGTK